MFMSDWREFPSTPSLARKKKLDSSRLNVVEIARVPDMLPSLFPSWSGSGLISTPVTLTAVIATFLIHTYFRAKPPPSFSKRVSAGLQIRPANCSGRFLFCLYV